MFEVSSREDRSLYHQSTAVFHEQLAKSLLVTPGELSIGQRQEERLREEPQEVRMAESTPFYDFSNTWKRISE